MMNLIEDVPYEFEDADRDDRRPTELADCELRRRMVRETELFLSYALLDGRNRRWIMLVKDAMAVSER